MSAEDGLSDTAAGAATGFSSAGGPPELDELQLGHLRHIVRLARQAPGDWSHMGPFDITQEGDDAYRYQLAYMVYTLALTQYHRTPAYRELYRDAMRALIEKMLRLDVWGYWELASKGSHVMDPDIAEVAKGWADPVVHKNVMYSGHLLMMVGLYEMLYRDHRYDEEGAITFEHRPPYHGLGPEDFRYDHKRLLDVIYAEFERNSFMGCECEPNGIFVYCNQPPMLGFMLYDHTHGTDIARPTLQRFKAAWSSRTSLFSDDPTASMPVFLLVKQDEVISEDTGDNMESASVIWWAPLIRIWNKDYVEAVYPLARDRAIVRHEDGAIGTNIQPFIEVHKEYQAAPARSMVDPMVLAIHDVGHMALSAKELGDDETLAGLLKYADTRLGSVSEDGAFWYLRNDDVESEAYCSALTGNVLLGAARLNVKDGFYRLFNEPWPAEAPARELELVDVDFPNVLIVRARANEEQTRIAIGTVPGADGVASSSIGVTGVDAADWTVEVDGRQVGTVGPGGLEVSAPDVDLKWCARHGYLTLSLDFSRPRSIVVARASQAS
jgi:hypothetical protein